jgi:hypothetical protein
MSNGSYPARLDLRAPNKVANWRPLVHWLLAIPQILIARVLGALRGVLSLISFFSVLFTRQIPEPIFNMIVMTRRYTWRTVSYTFWMRESYPPFSFTSTAQDDGLDPAMLSVDYPRELNRWLPLVKWLLAIPHYVVLLFLGIAQIFVIFPISFFVVLFTGSYPEGLRSYVVGVQRWALRVGAYVAFLRDEYPPFSLEDGGMAPAARSSAGPPFPGQAPRPDVPGQGPPVPPPPPSG